MIYVDEAVSELKKLFKKLDFTIQGQSKNSKHASFDIAKGKFETTVGFSASNQMFSMQVEKGTITVDTIEELEYTINKYSWLINDFIDKAKAIEPKFSAAIGVQTIYSDVISGKTQSQLIYNVLGTNETSRHVYIVYDNERNIFIGQLVSGKTPVAELHYSIEGNLIYDNNAIYMEVQKAAKGKKFTFMRNGLDKYGFSLSDGTKFTAAFKSTDSEIVDVTIEKLNDKEVESQFKMKGVDFADIENHIKNMIEMEDMNKPEKIDFEDSDKSSESSESSEEEATDTEDADKEASEMENNGELIKVVAVNNVQYEDKSNDCIMFVYPDCIKRVKKDELEGRFPLESIKQFTDIVDHKGISVTKLELTRHVFSEPADDVDKLVNDFFA